MPEYITCELRLDNLRQSTLTVSEPDAGANPAAYASAFAGESLLNAVANLTDRPEEYGSELFKAIFPDNSDIRIQYKLAAATAKRANKRLRFILSLPTNAPAQEADDLRRINWEWLYDPQLKYFLSRSLTESFCRRLGNNSGYIQSNGQNPRILAVLSNPENSDQYERLNLYRLSREELETSLNLALENSGWGFDFLEGNATPENIAGHLSNNQYQILHVQAHGVIAGDGQARLALQDEAGNINFVGERFFRDLFQTDIARQGIGLVTLMACNSGFATRIADPFSGLGLNLIQQNCPAVLLLDREMSEYAADLFTKFFYRALASSGQVDASCNIARQQLAMATYESSFIEWGLPTLYVNSPSGRLWDPAPAIPGGRAVARTPPGGGLVSAALLNRFTRTTVKRVIPVIGPEITQGWLLSDSELANLLATQVAFYQAHSNLPERYDLPRVAKALEVQVRDRLLVSDQICEIQKNQLIEHLKPADHLAAETATLEALLKTDYALRAEAGEPHKLLAELPFSLYLTTNNDNLLFNVLESAGRGAPKRASCLWKDDDGRKHSDEIPVYSNLEGTNTSPLVFHMFGTYDDDRTLLLNEDDYLEFLSNVSQEEWRIPKFIRENLTESTLLFLGYDIRTEEFRILFKTLVNQLKNLSSSNTRVALVQVSGDTQRKREVYTELIQNITNSDRIRIAPIFGDVWEFLVELRDKWRQANP